MPMMPKVRMIGRWGAYRVGDVLAPPAGLRQVLFGLKLAEFVDHQSARPAAPVKQAVAKTPEQKPVKTKSWQRRSK